ncbi:MAG: ubiquinol-cytochrome C chaperone family protein [Sphingomonas sp.]|nr:ubiquinol-cytochrome C chaperone family protein [Sphingomonas sp.]
MKRFLGGIFGGATTDDSGVTALYAAIVARGREPHWYLAGAVPDTMDGRFDMIAAILSLVLIRLEADPAAAPASVALTETFIEDMDAQLRQSGIGDVGLGKYVGQMVSMLGGRLGAYREGLAAGDLRGPLLRNLYRGVDPGATALTHVADALSGFAARLAEQPSPVIIAGMLP